MSRVIIVVMLMVCLLKFGDATVTFTTPAGGDASVELDENAAVGHLVVTIVATTDATPLGDFTLITENSPFALATTGALTVATATIDYETTQSYMLLIQGVDASSSATATLTVNVQDVNDAPMFAKASYDLCVVDKSDVGTTVATFDATDQDAGASLTYTITSGDSNSDFAIATKYLLVAKVLDRATTASYTLVVQVSDETLTATANFIVTVSTICESGASALIAGLAALLIGLLCAMN